MKRKNEGCNTKRRKAFLSNRLDPEHPETFQMPSVLLKFYGAIAGSDRLSGLLSRGCCCEML